MRLSRQILIVAGLAAVAVTGWYVTGGGKDNTPTATQIKPTAVVAAAATKGDVSVGFDAVGTLRANEAVTVTTKTSGIVASIHFDEGKPVAAGAVLMQMDATEVKADLAVAEANRRNTAQDLERSLTLLGRQAVAQARVDDLRLELQAAEARANAVRARLQDLTVTAPFAGVAGLRRVSPGALVRPGEEVTTVDDLSVLKLEFTVPESALRVLRQGQSITASTNVYAGESFTGTVTAIDTRVDPVTRTLAVVAALPNPDQRLKPGMFMTVRLMLETRIGVVLIPEEALIPVGDRQFVFAVVDGRASRRGITIGARQSGRVEVVEGLSVGDLVITRGVQKVRDGAPVTTSVDGAPVAATGP